MSTLDLRPAKFRTPVTTTLIAAVSVTTLAASLGLAFALWLLGLAGAQSFPVASDSMVPAFSRGDLVVTKPVQQLRVGDVVTFRKYNQLVTHRIVAEGRAPGTFETRGDANPGNDPWTISSADVTGRVAGVVRRAGAPLLALGSPFGRVLAVNVLLLLVFLLMWALPRAIKVPARLLHPSAGYAIS